MWAAGNTNLYSLVHISALFLHFPFSKLNIIRDFDVQTKSDIHIGPHFDQVFSSCATQASVVFSPSSYYLLHSAGLYIPFVCTLLIYLKLSTFLQQDAALLYFCTGMISIILEQFSWFLRDLNVIICVHTEYSACLAKFPFMFPFRRLWWIKIPSGHLRITFLLFSSVQSDLPIFLWSKVSGNNKVLKATHHLLFTRYSISSNVQCA